MNVFLTNRDADDRIKITPLLKLFKNDKGIFTANSIGTYNGEPYDGNEAYCLRVQGIRLLNIENTSVTSLAGLVIFARTNIS
jgi:hypothetical protein